MSKLTEIKTCRICGNSNLADLLDLGNQVLTGRFPKSTEESISSLPLELVKCVEDGRDHCGLVQLKHTGDLSEMYGEHYGYRSGLNTSMLRHLQAKIKVIESKVRLDAGDLVVDIGSNDSSTLQAYSKDLRLKQVGVDPTGSYFRKYYPPHIELIPDFFSAEKLLGYTQGRRAKVITSFSMFYDLEDPLSFMKQIESSLTEDGIWVFEQSYMPTMLEMNSYDTICHEHLEYYALAQIQWMAERASLKILDVEFNGVNGGSFSVTAAKAATAYRPDLARIRSILEQERVKGLHTLDPYREFRKRVETHRREVRGFFEQVKREKRRVFGYGASTKGNVMLQYCGLGPEDIPCIAEVNTDKWGSFTPGSLIPIVSEAEAKKLKPEYFMILPWHFRNNILEREVDFLKAGGRFVFPFPKLEVV